MVKPETRQTTGVDTTPTVLGQTTPKVPGTLWAQRVICARDTTMGRAWEKVEETRRTGSARSEGGEETSAFSTRAGMLLTMAGRWLGTGEVGGRGRAAPGATLTCSESGTASGARPPSGTVSYSLAMVE